MRGGLGSDGVDKEARSLAKQAEAVGQNARGMVLVRDVRYSDLVALVAQNGATLTSVVDQVSGISGQLGLIAENLAANGTADKALAAQVAQSTADLTEKTSAIAEDLATVDERLTLGLAQLTATDEEIVKRLHDAELAVQNEATVRAAADTAEAAARAKADADEARARADADKANADKAAAADAAELAARKAADDAEAASRAAADTLMAARIAALETKMPAVATGRAMRTSLLLLAGATVDIPVVFDTPAPTADYTPLPVLDAPNLSSYTPVGYKNKTAQGITLTVKNNSLVSLTATVYVTIIALKL